MTGTQVESKDAAEPDEPGPSATTARRRTWLLEGLSEQSARHPGPHATPDAEHEGHK